MTEDLGLATLYSKCIHNQAPSIQTCKTILNMNVGLFSSRSASAGNIHKQNFNSHYLSMWPCGQGI